VYLHFPIEILHALFGNRRPKKHLLVPKPFCFKTTEVFSGVCRPKSFQIFLEAARADEGTSGHGDTKFDSVSEPKPESRRKIQMQGKFRAQATDVTLVQQQKCAVGFGDLSPASSPTQTPDSIQLPTVNFVAPRHRSFQHISAILALPCAKYIIN
jgi:hypothetical protein